MVDPCVLGHEPHGDLQVGLLGHRPVLELLRGFKHGNEAVSKEEQRRIVHKRSPGLTYVTDGDGLRREGARSQVLSASFEELQPWEL